jgi:broad specificity phosphatase PhoE
MRNAPEVESDVLRLILLRHADAVSDGRCIGWTDVPLSDRGRAQCASLIAADGMLQQLLADRSGDLYVESSDVSRARDTAAAISECFEVPVHENADLREMHFGAWEGRTWGELEVEDGERLATWMAHWQLAAPPGGESLAHMQRRVATALRRLRQRPERRVLVVSHAGWIRLALCLLQDRPVREMFEITVPHAQPIVLSVARRSL